MSKNSSDYSILIGSENISLVHHVTKSVVTAKILGVDEEGDTKTYWLDGRLMRAAMSGCNDGLSWSLTGAISTVCKVSPAKVDELADPAAS